jgi:hypothetical protein
MIGALLSDDNDHDELPFSDPTFDPYVKNPGEIAVHGPKLMYGTGLFPPSKLTPSRSDETTMHRWDQDLARHREGVFRCLPASQIVFGRHHCAYQTLRGARPPNRPVILESSHDIAVASIPGMQGCRRQA